MKITHQNVDKWLFDYCEGNLNPADKKQLFAFIEENPEYREDLDAWKDSFLTPEPVPVFEEADALLVPETVAWRPLAVACLALLLVGGTAGYMLTNNGNAIKHMGAGNGNDNNSTQQEQTYTLNENTSTLETLDNTTSNKKRDALPSTHTPGNLPRIHSPYLVNNTASQSSHNSTSNASLYSSVVNTNTPEGSNFDPNGQAITKNQLSLSGAETDEIPADTDENQANSDQLGDEQIKPADNSYIPWQFTRLSDLNPDYLAKQPARDYSVKEGDDKFVYTQPKGFILTNVNEHELLQPSLFSFQQNASFSGGYRQLEGTVGTRGRWLGSEHSAYEVMVGFQDYKRKWKSAYGMYAQHTSYMEGGINMTSANMFVSPKFKMDRYTWLEPSLSVSYTFMNVSPRLFNEERQLEVFAGQAYATQMGVVKGTQSFFDMKAGVQLQTKKAYVVLGIGNIMRPNITILNNETSDPYRMPMSMDLTIGTDLKSRRFEELVLSPQAGFVAQGLYNRAWGGMKLRYGNVYTAASASYRGEIFATAGVRTKIGSFAYKFDLTESVLANKKMMSHGITAALYLRSFSNRIHPILDHGIGK